MKRVLCVIFAVFLLVLPLCVSAQRTMPRYVFDEAGLLNGLSDSQRQDILTSIANVNEKHGISVAVLFVESFDGEDEVSFADDFYDVYIGDESGVLLVYSVEDDIRYVSTCGSCIGAIDGNLSDITEAISDHFFYENYGEGIKAFAATVDNLMSSQRSKGLTSSIVISVVVGFVVALIVTGSMKSKLNGARFNDRAENYVKDGSLNLTVSRDLFLYRTVSRTAKPQNNSSTHKSGSGRIHGGGRV